MSLAWGVPVAKAQRQKTPAKKARMPVAVKWLAVAVLVAVAVYAVSTMSGVAYDEDDIKVVNFQGLSPKQRTDALEAANTARCTCGCGLGLAQCVSTDPNCPIREGNVERIKGMVRQALATKTN